MPPTAPLDPPALARSLDRQYVIGLVCMLLLIVAFPLYRLGEPARRRAARVAMERESIALGRDAFGRHCAACHGAGGDGGSIAPTLHSRELLGATTDQQLYWIISGGIPGSPMSAYHIDLGGPFTPQEIDRVVRYLRALEAGAPSVPEWRRGVRRADTAPERQHQERGLAPR